jgi:hypothetical protein
VIPSASAGVTDAQALALLMSADGVAYGKGCEVLDSGLNVVSDISGDLLGGSVSRSMRAAVHGTCSLVLASDVNYQSQLLRPYMTITAAGVTGKWYQGAYVPRKPTSAYGESLPSNAIDGSDRLYLLNRPVGNSYVVAAGTGVLAAVRQAISDAGFSSSTLLLDGTASAATLPIQKVWPLLPDTSTTSAPVVTAADAVTSGASNGTTWLQIVNELLAMVSYRGLWCDWLGLFRSEPYANPAGRPVEATLDYGDVLRSVIARGRSVTQDFSTIPNVWIFVQQNLGASYASAPPEPTEGAGLYTVDEHDDPTTPGYRGGLKWPVVIPLDAADQASLVAQGNARVAADKRVTKTLTVTTAPFPAAWHWDVYSYTDPDMGATYKVQSTQWQLDLGSNGLPADEQHTWEVVQ